MLIVCDNCGAEYEVDVDDDDLGSAPGRGLRFRCSACGHTFTISDDSAHSGEFAAAEADGSLGPSDDAEPAMLLKQEGKVYQVEGAATLQRWIVERRVLREDMISIGGLKWEPVGSRRDLQVFFHLVDHAERAALGGVGGDMPPPLSGFDSGALQGAAPWEGGAAGGSLPSAESDIDAFMAPEADPDEFEEDEGTDAGLPIVDVPPSAGAGYDADALSAPDPLRAVPNLAPGEPASADSGSAGAADATGVDTVVTRPLEGPSAGAAASAVAGVSPTADTLTPESDRSPFGESDVTEEVSPSVVSSAVADEPSPPGGGLDPDMLFPGETDEQARASDRAVAWGPTTPPTESGIPPWAIAVAVIAVLLVGGWWWTQNSSGAGGPAVATHPATGPTSDGGPAAPADGLAGPAADGPAADGTAADGPAADGTAADGTAADGTAADGTAADGTAADEVASDEAAPEGTSADGTSDEQEVLTPVVPKTVTAPPPAPVVAASAPAPTPAATSTPSSSSNSSSSSGSSGSPAKLVEAGWTAIEKGRYSDARGSFAAALEAQPGNSDARFGLGYSYEKLGNEPAAVRYYCRVASAGGGDARIEAEGRLRALGAPCE